MALLIVRVKDHESHITSHASRFTFYILRFLLAILVTLLPVFLWDFARNQSPGFWQLSLINYGGLDTASSNFGKRWWEFVELLKYGTASPILNLIFIVGLPLRLAYGLWPHRSTSHSQISKINDDDFSPTPLAPYSVAPMITDWIFTLFTLAFLLAHIILSFQVWDRYLLGLIPILALLLARILLLPWAILKQHWLGHQPKFLPVASLITGLALVYLLTLTLAHPVQDAANARYPLGSHSHALSGIEQIVAYLQGNTNAGTTLYHHWLGYHYRFYLYDTPLRLHWSPDSGDLIHDATIYRREPRYIGFASWRDSQAIESALAAAGIELAPVHESTRRDGTESFRLYELKGP